MNHVFKVVFCFYLCTTGLYGQMNREDSILNTSVNSLRYPWSTPIDFSNVLKVKYSNDTLAVDLDFDSSRVLQKYTTYYYKGNIAVQAKRWNSTMNNQVNYSSEVNSYFENGNIRSIEIEGDENSMLLGFDVNSHLVYQRVMTNNNMLEGLFLNGVEGELIRYDFFCAGILNYIVFTKPYSFDIIRIETNEKKKIHNRKVYKSLELALQYKR